VFTEEDGSVQADSILSLGNTIEATFILNPAPEIPIRLDIVSTTPSIIYPSHKTITFNRGEKRGTVTLESPQDGQIGVATILVTPEKLGFYRPLSFTVTVQGYATLVQLDDCVAASLPAEFEIDLWPPAPDDQVFIINSSNGLVSNNTFTFTTGDLSGVFTFTGRTIGNSSITISSALYESYTLHFPTLGRILSDADRQAIQGAPERVNVTVFPTPTGANTVPIDVITSNAEIIPSPSFSVGALGEVIEVRPQFFGFSNVTYTSPGYCPLSDFYTVAEAPVCSLSSEANILGTKCYPCPGIFTDYNYYLPTTRVCLGQGTCGYTHCFTDRVTCSCEADYVGYACQWNTIFQAFEFDSSVLDESPFVLNIFPSTLTGPLELSAPGNLINETLQPGLAIAAPYPFYGAVDPDDDPPMQAEYTGLTFYWENTCYENALVTSNFTAPVEAKFPMDPNVYSNQDLLEVQLCLWNSTSEKWVDSIDGCTGAGFDVQRSTDLYTFTFNTFICQPGQYALFVIPISSPVPNTGNTNNPHPGAEDVSDTFFLISTGWQPAPPLPLPIVAGDYDPSPPLNNPFGTGSPASTLLVSFGVVLLAILLHL